MLLLQTLETLLQKLVILEHAKIVDEHDHKFRQQVDEIIHRALKAMIEKLKEAPKIVVLAFEDMTGGTTTLGNQTDLLNKAFLVVDLEKHIRDGWRDVTMQKRLHKSSKRVGKIA